MTNTTLARTGWAQRDPVLTKYYDTEWGEPVTDERGVFERLCLESFQSGLSWLTILRKREAFRDAFNNFDPEAVSLFGEEKIAQLLDDESIIRNERKIRAVITNAQQTLKLRDEGGIVSLVWSHMPSVSPFTKREADLPTQSIESRALATELKQRRFTMVGPTTVYALMTAIGMVDGHVSHSHRRGCSGLWNRDGTRTRRAQELLRSLNIRV